MSKTLSPSSSLIFLVLFLASNAVQTIHGCTLFTPKYTVRIANYLTTDPALSIHCQSRENDLGQRLLPRGFPPYSFSFCNNIGSTTLFFCRFDWGGKYQDFDVFNKHLKNECSGRVCNWDVANEGFYLTGERPVFNLTKKYDWLGA